MKFQLIRQKEGQEGNFEILADLELLQKNNTYQRRYALGIPVFIEPTDRIEAWFLPEDPAEGEEVILQACSGHPDYLSLARAMIGNTEYFAGLQALDRGLLRIYRAEIRVIPHP